MICPKCKHDAAMLLFTGSGTMCQACKHGVFSVEESRAALDAIACQIENRQSPIANPEEAMQERPAWYEAIFAAVIFGLFAIGASAFAIGRAIRTWLTFRTDCCFCTPHHRLKGNPFVRKNISHGICKKAMARELDRSQAIRFKRSIEATLNQLRKTRTHKSTLP